MNDVIDALAAWRGQEISREEMLWRLLANENMGLAVGPDSDVNRFALADARLIPDAAGRARLFLFTAGYRSEAFEAEQNFEFSNPTGWEIFAADLAGVDAVVVDVGAPHEFVIECAEFPALKELAEAVAIHEVWQRLHDGDEEPGDVSRAASYPNYHLVAVQREGGSVLIFAPHDDGRQMVPIFTHPGALAQALEEFRETFAPAEGQTLKVSGAQAFPVLANQHDAGGLVFDFRGPGEPIAFQLGVTELMLAELAKTPSPR